MVHISWHWCHSPIGIFMIICRKPKGVLTFCGERAIVVMNLGRFFLSMYLPTEWCVLYGTIFFLCQKQIFQTGISNSIPQKTVGCKYLSLPEIPASGTKVIICLSLSITVSIIDSLFPTNKVRNNFVIIASKRLFGVIITYLQCSLFTGFIFHLIIKTEVWDFTQGGGGGGGDGVNRRLKYRLCKLYLRYSYSFVNDRWNYISFSGSLSK